MKRKLAAGILSVSIAASLLSGCGGSKGSSNTADAEKGAVELTAEEQEAVDAGIIQLDGSLPIIKDPAKFEEKYGKIKVLNVGDAQRVTKPEDIEMVKKWTEDTGVSFEWTTIPPENAGEKINLMLTAGNELPDVFWNFEGSQSGITVAQYADQNIFLPTETIVKDYMM